MNWTIDLFRQNRPSIACAIHCGILAILPGAVHSVDLHHPVMEVIEVGLIIAAPIYLIYKLWEIRTTQKRLFWIGVTLGISVIATAWLAPHLALVGHMLGIAAFQSFVVHKHCKKCPV